VSFVIPLSKSLPGLGLQIVMPGEGVGSGNPNSSPRKRQMKRQPSNLSDKVRTPL
jgi:hypothetical protein